MPSRAPMSASVQPSSSRSTVASARPGGSSSMCAGVRLVGAEPGPLAPVTAGGAHLARLDQGPLEVGVEVAALHAGLSSPPADLEPLGGGQAPEPGR